MLLRFPSEDDMPATAVCSVRMQRVFLVTCTVKEIARRRIRATATTKNTDGGSSGRLLCAMDRVEYACDGKRKIHPRARRGIKSSESFRKPSARTGFGLEPGRGPIAPHTLLQGSDQHDNRLQRQ